MAYVYVIMKQNTRGPREATVTGTSYSTREQALKRAENLKAQSRLTPAGRAEKPEFRVEKVSVPEG